MRVKLINKISEDILKSNDDIKDIVESVKEYSILLDENLRNFYELQTMGGKCPLFQIVYYLENGVNGMGMTEDEFNVSLEILDSLIKEKFGYSILEKIEVLISEDL